MGDFLEISKTGIKGKEGFQKLKIWKWGNLKPKKLELLDRESNFNQGLSCKNSIRDEGCLVVCVLFPK